MAGEETAGSGSGPTRCRSPRFARLDAAGRQSVLAALRCLHTHGLASIGSVEESIAELEKEPPLPAEAAAGVPPRPAAEAAPPAEQEYPLTPPLEELLRDLRGHLSAAKGADTRSAVYQWLCTQPWWWGSSGEAQNGGGQQAGGEAQPARADAPPKEENPRTGQCGSADEGPGAAKSPAQLVTGVVQVVQVVHDTLQRYAKGGDVDSGQASVSLEVAKSDSLGFAEISDTFRNLTQDISGPGVPTFVQYPTRKQIDDYRCRTTIKRVLMQVAIRLQREASFYQTERQFELCVNLLGECSHRTGEPKDAYTEFLVITAQGQLRRGANPGWFCGGRSPRQSLAGSLATEAPKEVTSGRDAVTRCKDLTEGFYRFKVALVRAIEHTIHHVIHSDFMNEMESKVWDEKEVTTTEGRLDAGRLRGSCELKPPRARNFSHDSGVDLVEDEDTGGGLHRSWSCKIPTSLGPALPVASKADQHRLSQASSCAHSAAHSFHGSPADVEVMPLRNSPVPVPSPPISAE
eukprot:TRINITY_DN23404_c0_g1_i1.p1 TRINITY_DN23404_c0_g1~~TRINITY_DN23404_c0_g1_i1.p1  ORF type:complete len:518 (+),score=92.51 TRINITY_DN23404_c0_g1_i1:78-1631(+)